LAASRFVERSAHASRAGRLTASVRRDVDCYPVISANRT